MKKETAFITITRDLSQLIDKTDRRSHKKFVAKFKYLAMCLNATKDDLANDTMIWLMKSLDDRYKKLVVLGQWKKVISSIKSIYIKQDVDRILDRWAEEGYGKN